MAVAPSVSYSLTVRPVSPGEPSEEYIIPSVFNKVVAPAVAGGVARTAHQTGAPRRRRRREATPVW